MYTNLGFCPTLAEMIATGRSLDNEGRSIRLTGVSSLNSLLILRNLHDDLQAKRTLEVGLGFAGSCLVFVQTHKDHGSPPQRQHIAIDPFQSHLGFAGLAAVKRADLASYLEHVDSSSDRALSALLERGLSCRLAYVDGSHLFEDVFLDCHYVAQLLAPNGVVVFDDSSDRHIHKVLQFVRTNMGHLLREIDLSPYRPDQGKSMKYRLARRMGRTQLRAFRKIGEGRRPWDSKLHNF
jgi:hypothetical protein